MSDAGSSWWLGADKMWRKGQPPSGWHQTRDGLWHPPPTAATRLTTGSSAAVGGTVGTAGTGPVGPVVEIGPRTGEPAPSQPGWAPYGGMAQNPYGNGASAPYGGVTPTPYDAGTPTPYGAVTPTPHDAVTPTPFGAMADDVPTDRAAVSWAATAALPDHQDFHDAPSDMVTPNTALARAISASADGVPDNGADGGGAAPDADTTADPPAPADTGVLGQGEASNGAGAGGHPGDEATGQTSPQGIEHNPYGTDTYAAPARQGAYSEAADDDGTYPRRDRLVRPIPLTHDDGGDSDETETEAESTDADADGTETASDARHMAGGEPPVLWDVMVERIMAWPAWVRLVVPVAAVVILLAGITMATGGAGGDTGRTDEQTETSDDTPGVSTTAGGGSSSTSTSSSSSVTSSSSSSTSATSSTTAATSAPAAPSSATTRPSPSTTATTQPPPPPTSPPPPPSTTTTRCPLWPLCGG